MAAVYSEMSHRYIFLNKDGVVEQRGVVLLCPALSGKAHCFPDEQWVTSDQWWRMCCRHRILPHRSFVTVSGT